MIRRLARDIVDSTPAWRWARNPGRTLRHVRSGAGAQSQSDVGVLQSEGLVVRPADQVLESSGLQHLDNIAAATDVRMQDAEVQTALANPGSLGTRKGYRLHLAAKELDVDSPLIQLAIHPGLLARVNGYLGMWSYLREVQISLDMPTPGEAKETQLWHRDDDDHANVKAFIYLNAVTEGGGPFCFVPRTHVFGDLKQAIPPGAVGRMSDDEMARGVPPAAWTRCTGARPGPVILADTTGFHKGLKPQTQHRVLVSLHYTSGTPRYPRSFTLRQASSAGLQPLKDVQRVHSSRVSG